MRHDVLELTSLGGALTQTVAIVRGSFQPHEGFVSFKRAEGDDGREYVPWSVLERVRHLDQSRANP